MQREREGRAERPRERDASLTVPLEAEEQEPYGRERVVQSDPESDEYIQAKESQRAAPVRGLRPWAAARPWTAVTLGVLMGMLAWMQAPLGVACGSRQRRRGGPVAHAGTRPLAPLVVGARRQSAMPTRRPSVAPT